MKPSYPFAACAAAVFAVPLMAGMPSSPETKSYGHSFMEQNAAMMTNVNGHLTVDTLYGYTTARGYQLHATPAGSHSLYFLTGWFYGTQSAHGEFDLRLSQEMLPFYAGYRYEWNITDAWTAYAGIHAGYLYSRSTQKASGVEDDIPFSQKLTTSSNSFAFGGSVGLTWQFSKNWAVTAGYTFTEFLPIKRFTNDDSYPKNSSAMTGTVNLGLTMIFDDMSVSKKDDAGAPWHFSATMGMIHSNSGYVLNGDQWTASNMYGAGFYAGREVMTRDKFSERLGFKTGYYYGQGANRYGSDWMLEIIPGIPWSASDFYSVKNEVSVIPLLITYDWAYQITPSFTFSWGLAGGAIIKKTKFQLDSQWIVNGEQYEDIHTKMDSTRILPTVGVRFGFEVRMTEHSSMFISYDFMQSFGRDSKTPTCPDEWYQERCDNIPKKNRYFGLVSAGVTYRY